jgi:hypothetical protein
MIVPVLTLGLLATTPASAAGMSGLAAVGNVDTAAASNLIQIRGYGRRYGHRNRRQIRRAQRYNHNRARRSRRRHRRNLAIGLGLGIFGAAILANRHYDNSRHYSKPVRSYSSGYSGGGYRNAKRRCARTFDEYSWRTDLIYDRYGDQRLCPYVRKYY